MISGSGNVFLASLLVALLVGEQNKRGLEEVERVYINLLIFYAEILLCELARELDQDPMGSALRVLE
jgi:hypothetical protein